VTSDHGHSEVLADDERSVVQLERVLCDVKRADIARGWHTDDEIMICPNMRAAQIYLRTPTAQLVNRVVDATRADPRIDLAMWHGRITGDAADVYVVESGRGRFEFRRGEGHEHTGRDVYGTVWSWRGDPGALGLQLDGDVFESTDYPNALERLAGVLDAPNSGEIWVTAQPGCEFEVSGGKAHAGGGSHGALHALDSLSPVIIAGANAPALPRRMRSVDIAPLCMELLGLSMKYRVGQSRR
jgi:hypothetical protein